jgi:hypothetical protein
MKLIKRFLEISFLGERSGPMQIDHLIMPERSDWIGCLSRLYRGARIGIDYFISYF